MTVAVATRPTPYRPAVSKHALAMLPATHVAAPAISPEPITEPIQLAPEIVVEKPAKVVSQWAPIPCHTILPPKRFRLF
jgi:hypothetical protein